MTVRAINAYGYMQERFEKIVPIRGRAVEVRPIDKRSRDWETIVKRSVIDGEATYTAYAARLYQTDVVTYHVDGTVAIKCEQWSTPTTAEFIWRWAPMGVHCFKRHNRLWVVLHGVKEYLVPVTGSLLLRMVEGVWEVINPQPMVQKIVDRKAIKAKREVLLPFKNFCRTILKLADGWIQDETMCAYGKIENAYSRRAYAFTLSTGEVFNMFKSRHAEEALLKLAVDVMEERRDLLGVTNEDDNMRLFLAMLQWCNSTNNKLVGDVESVPDADGRTRMIRIYDTQYSVTAIDNLLDRALKEDPSVFTTREVPAGRCVANVR